VNAITLTPVPNPQGTMVAVEVRPATGHGSSGIVVLSRTGKVLGSQSPGMAGIPAMAWARSGTSLAFIGRGAYGPELTRWTVGGQSTTGNFPVYSGAVSRCAWSPDGVSVLCMAGQSGRWLVAQSGTFQYPRGQGFVLAWLPGGLGG